MDQNINKLITIIREMVGIFEDLLLAAAEKHRQLLSCDVYQLERTTKREMELLNRIMLLEERSGSILHDINVAFLNTSSLVLGELVRLGKNGRCDCSEDLMDVYARLKDLADRLRKVNEQNQDLARFSLGVIRDTVRFICKESVESSTYRRSGGVEVTESLLNLVDTQA